MTDEDAIRIAQRSIDPMFHGSGRVRPSTEEPGHLDVEFRAGDKTTVCTVSPAGRVVAMASCG